VGEKRTFKRNIAEKETCICGTKKDLQKKYSSKRDVHM